MKPCVRSILTCAALLITFAETPAAVGFRQLTSVYPAAVQRGTKATIVVNSNFTLDGAYQVFFDRPGIRMTYAETKPIEAPLKGRGAPGTPFHFDVEVPADQEPGIYEFRVATEQAVSSVSHLLVTEYPVVEEQKQENGQPAVAQKVPVPSAVCGLCNKAEDVDCYRIAGKQGQELTFQIYAQRVTQAIHDMVGGGHYHMDAILSLLNSHGQIIAQNDNALGGDALLYAKLPADGEYVLEVRDTRYAGDPRYTYCVEISDRPLATAVFPFVVQRGTSIETELVGYGVPPGAHGPLAAAASESIGSKTVRFATSAGETNPVKVLVSEHPQLVLSAGHTSAASALPLTLPVGVSGRFNQPNSAHFFSFEAVKDQDYLFEVIAGANQLPLDAVLEIYSPKGAKLTEIDDSVPTQDPKLYFHAPAGGRFVVSIRDLPGRSGDNFIYHLRAEPVGPDFELQGEYYYGLLAPGTRTMWFAKVVRLNGFTGPVEMDVRGLPPGVSFIPATIPAGMDQCAVILIAAPDAKVGASLAQVFGKATIPGPAGKLRDVIHQGQVACELQSQGGGQGRWPIHTQLVGVTKGLDLRKLTATPDEITLKPGSKAEINVTIERAEGFADPVGLDMAFTYFTIKWGEQLPPGVTVSSASKTRLTGKTLEGKIVLEAGKTPLAVRRLPVAVIASVSISFSINTLYASNPIYLTVEGVEPGPKK